jgi:hypothetical protein
LDFLKPNWLDKFMPNQPTPSLPLYAEEQLRVKTSLLDMGQFRLYCLDLHSTIAAITHTLTASSGLSAATVYQYHWLLRRLLARVSEAEREFKNRAAEAVEAEGDAESEKRRPPDRFSRWSKGSKRRSDTTPT